MSLLIGMYFLPLPHLPKGPDADTKPSRVYTALEKGFHTPEFVYAALRDRRFPKESKHDIYCSRCGELTSLRRRPGTPPEIPKVNKKLLRLWKEALVEGQASVEKDISIL
jgi:hypothetical protein